VTFSPLPDMTTHIPLNSTHAQKVVCEVIDNSTDNNIITVVRVSNIAKLYTKNPWLINSVQ